eukprot:scaffold20823_cov101-Skeletonema_dohrnii-CCMP3373.AAC.1
MAEMSADKVDNMKMCCASCGVAEVDEIELMECSACDLVRYCSDKCQKNHKSQHTEACKKRAAELRDELLFKQPESTHLGDCPICYLPLQLDPEKSFMMACCSKTICNGCDYANERREKEASLDPKCPFCRQPVQAGDKLEKQRMKRIEANDRVAMRQWGSEQFDKGDYQSALTYFTKAAKLGDVDSHFRLAALYHLGKGVEKDSGKKFHHLEEAAIGGHPNARYNLGIEEGNYGNAERAVKHFIIAAKQGYDNSIKPLMPAYRNGLISKEDLAAVLRAHQAAIDATKSPQRDTAEEFYLG